MVEWCLLCHKVTEFLPVQYRPSPHSTVKQSIPGLWHCAECHMVIFREIPITDEEMKAARERASLLEGFD